MNSKDMAYLKNAGIRAGRTFVQAFVAVITFTFVRGVPQTLIPKNHLGYAIMKSVLNIINTSTPKQVI
jgi:hypothetical protein